MDYMPTESHTPPKFDTLFIRNHRPIDLVDAAIATFSTYTHEQTSHADALEKLVGDFKRAVEMDTEKDMPSPDTEIVTNALAKKLGEVFLLNSLKDVKYTWDRHMKGVLGETIDTGRETHVSMKWPKDRQERPNLHLQFLSTMLHEGVHAMLHKFSCRNQVCGSSTCKSSWSYESGEDDGHGLAFHKMAKAIEDRSQWYFRVKLDLGRRVAVDWGAREMFTPENVVLYFQGKCPFSGNIYDTNPPYDLLQKGEKPKDPRGG